MFGKLFKYEMKSTYKTYFLLFGILILVSFMPFLGNALNNKLIEGFGFMVVSLSIIPSFVVYIITTIQRYNSNLYGDEGYLMFTLPIKPWQIIGSKLLSATIWAIVTSIVGILIFFLANISINGTWKEFIEVINALFELVDFQYFILFSALIIAYGVNTIMMAYLSISLSNISIIKSANMGVATIIFFVLNYIEVKIIDVIISNSEFMIFDYDSFGEVKFMYGVAIQYLIIAVISTAILFFATNYILSKKLHVR